MNNSRRLQVYVNNSNALMCRNVYGVNIFLSGVAEEMKEIPYPQYDAKI